MKPFSLRAVPMMAAIMLATGCSSLNPFASSAPKSAPLVDFKPTTQIVPVWEASIGKAGGYVFQPAVVGDSVYAAGHAGEVARFEKNGQAAWRARAGVDLSAGVGADGALAVVVTTDGKVVAYDAQTGTERWRTPIGAEVLAPPAVGGDVVVVRTSDHRLVALNARDGSRRWVHTRSNPPLALRSYAGVVIEGAVVLAGFPGGKLGVINLANGGAITELTVSAPRGATELERVADVAGTPVTTRREVCAVSYQGRAACFDAGNGNALWARDFSSSVGMDRDTRYAVITDDRDAVNALDVYSGASVWKQDGLARRGVTRPLLVGDNVVVGDAQGFVHVLARDTGAFAARDRADSSAIVAPPRAQGTGFVVQSLDGRITAYELR
ncbi:outer membrane protein assembly factor BamB [Thauera sinica]|uniref:Outer membrane protein assembly factor BamB n=1 Tax=Thauera sinica TaxID=2665146 RepID=A0ABW1AY95_9RHOO|nr:outer membrane protein assembly factor BamB [Thauera sp. K11]ATE58934.1 outer membrane protein assembly factor BamB [Thauera sp. K11]